ncbi:Adenylosuccinate lyase [Camellia lanceoleosa]|uniref:Adenylosuccinate lyase n=1 Tax=Camellia lanceoleosa TaxID=1840588 RepID=A0ACC0I335_9ERIC|nr:Adenylosuccinate lyase [Camellia lanceoleosa]
MLSNLKSHRTTITTISGQSQQKNVSLPHNGFCAIRDTDFHYGNLLDVVVEKACAASPTTLGKEIAILAARLSRERRDIFQVEIMGKFAGAVRNYNAHLVAYPDIKWPQIAEEFVKSLGLSFNPYVTQIETHDYMAKLFPCKYPV